MRINVLPRSEPSTRLSSGQARTAISACWIRMRSDYNGPSAAEVPLRRLESRRTRSCGFSLGIASNRCLPDWAGGWRRRRVVDGDVAKPAVVSIRIAQHTSVYMFASVQPDIHCADSSVSENFQRLRHALLAARTEAEQVGASIEQALDPCKRLQHVYAPSTPPSSITSDFVSNGCCYLGQNVKGALRSVQLSPPVV